MLKHFHFTVAFYSSISVLPFAVLGLCCAWAFLQCGEQGLLPSCGAQASHCGGFSRCGARASVAAARGLCICSHQALEHRLSSFGAQAGCSKIRRVCGSRDWTFVSCIGRQILYHWVTREALIIFYYLKYFPLTRYCDKLVPVRL